MLLKEINFHFLNEDGVTILMFRNENNYFQIQDTKEYDQQDIDLNQNIYYLELNDQIKGGYSGISRIELNLNILTIDLNEIGKKNIGLSRIEMILIKMNNEKELLLKKELIKVIEKYKISTNLK